MTLLTNVDAENDLNWDTLASLWLSEKEHPTLEFKPQLCHLVW